MLSIKVPEDVNYSISPRSVCALYLMLKLHFSGKYDVIKYNWKYSISEASFNSRRDTRFFEKIAHKYMLHDLTYIFVSSLLNTSNNWIGGMTSEMAITEYRKYGTILKMYEREFRKEIEILILYCQREKIAFTEIIKYNKERDSSRLIKMLGRGIIKYETFLILDRFFNIIDNYDKVSNDYEWMGYSEILKAYRKLLLIDVDLYLGILETELKNKLDLNINTEKIQKISKIIGEKYDVIK